MPSRALLRRCRAGSINRRRPDLSRPILVTGGAGSMGRLVIQQLRNAGKRVRAFDLPSADFSPFDSDSDIEVAAGDITSASDVAAAVEGWKR